MSNKLTPVLTSLLIGPITLPAAASSAPPTSIERSFPASKGFKSSALRKMRYEGAYQNNLIAIQQAEIARGKWVGELQEMWQFPSDHLPIGMSIDGLNLCSWNVLNSEYMSWVEKNTQGLSRSQIAKEHIYINETKLTIRDLHVIENIKSMLEHPTHPRSIVSLQECSQAFIDELQRQLPEEYGVVLSSNTAITDQNIVIYDKRVLEYDPSLSKIEKGVFSIQPDRSLMNLCFHQKQGSNQTIRVINAHLPGEPGNPAPRDFAAYVADIASSDTLTIAMGDMNFSEVEMGAAFESQTPPGMTFNLVAPYCTNIGVDLHSKSIDHFFIYAQGQHKICKHNPEELLMSLSQTVHLLDPDCFICL